MGSEMCIRDSTDVVPTGPVENWKFPPFSGHIEDGMMYGRGTADMKGSIAAFLDSVEEFLAENNNPKY